MAPILVDDGSSPTAQHTRPSSRTQRLSTHLVNMLPASQRRLHVSPFVFTLCWWFVFSIHVINGSIAMAFAFLYFFFTLGSIYPTISVVQVSLRSLQVSAWGYAVLAIFHAIELVAMIQRSLREKQLVFTSPSPRIFASGFSSTKLVDRLGFVRQQFWVPWNLLFGIDGIFGVNGPHFYVVFFLREALEMVLQTYQASQLSGSVRRTWITQLAVAVIVLNATTTPIVEVLFRKHSENVRRFVSLLVDTSLDFCCAGIIPLCVLIPLISTYDPSIGSLPPRLVYDDTFFIASIAEIRQFCITSTLDFCATMMPHLSVYTCLNATKKLVRRQQPEDNRRVVPTTKALSKLKRAALAVTAVSHGADSSHARSRQSTLEKKRLSKLSGRLQFLFHFLMVSWMVTVLVIHIQADSHATTSAVRGCRLSLNAWFAVQTPCAVMQVNCFHDQIQGRAIEIANQIAPLDREKLKKLIIIHCPALEIPSLLLEFNALTDLDLYNSTLLSWPMEAAATKTSLASLNNFNWFASPYIRFPDGLLHSDLPAGFTRFSIAQSNITELPDELGTIWATQSLDLFSVQSTRLARLPSSFHKLHVTKLRLISNQLTEIPDGALATQRLRVLHFSGNAIRKWPASIGDTSKLVELLAEHTQIADLPVEVCDWWASRPRSGIRLFSLSLVGSPFCDPKTNGSDVEQVCGIDYGNANGTYLWNLIQAQRGLDK